MVDGRKMHVVSHMRVNKDANTFLVATAAKKYQGRLHRVDLTRAWVDVSKGCLPLKMEWESYYVFSEEGKSYSTRSGPYLTLEVKSVEQIENGGYYPTKGVLTRNGQVSKDNLQSPPPFDDFLREKTPKLSWAPLEEDGWDAYLVQAGKKIEPTLFELEFPKNTVYFDQLAQKGMSTSDTQEIIDEALNQVTPSRTPIPGTGKKRLYPTLIALNALAFAAVVSLFLMLRRRAGRRPQS
jgi:hypothetical protein